MAHEKTLAAIPLFSRLEKDDIARLAKSVVPRSYAKGATIVKEGEQAVAFYVIVSGKVDVTKGGEKVGEKRAGQPFGEMALLDGFPRSTTVVASEDTECLVMTRWDFTAELKSNPSMALSMLPELSKIIRRLEGEHIP
ncbi:MAG: cyclic nucleotide-binding domain-containing protein [Chloroflexi bacterium]|nr:cyclic nucleotide-binding domain-containing protein [Chloroflexota bacterium]